MSLLDDDTLNDINLAREIITKEDVSVVVVQYGKIWSKKKGKGIRPILEVVDELGQDIKGAVIGDRILGKASSLLCRYSKVGGVYSPQGTKTAIALLIMGGIPCQIDQLIPQITNKSGNGLCPFEKLLRDVNEPEEAYNILRKKVIL